MSPVSGSSKAVLSMQKSSSSPRPGSPRTASAKRCTEHVASGATSAPVLSCRYAEEATLAWRAVNAASRLARGVQRDMLAADAVSKSDDSPVTIADYGCQAVVAYLLSKEGGGKFEMIAEEDSSSLREAGQEAMVSRIVEAVNATLEEEEPGTRLSAEEVLSYIDLGGSSGGNQGQIWVLDPIDGTIGFVAGRQYAVALALLDDGVPVLGLLGCPNLPENGVDGPAGEGSVFIAARGEGAYAGTVGGPIPSQRISMNDSLPITKARFMESVVAKHSNHSFSAKVAEGLGIAAPPVRIDSQAKYGALARGDGQAYMRFPSAGYKEKIWDHAGGYVVITEAGGVVSDRKGAELDFGKGRYLETNGGIIAATRSVHGPLVETVNNLLLA